jgi:hypothetical protein
MASPVVDSSGVAWPAFRAAGRSPFESGDKGPLAVFVFPAGGLRNSARASPPLAPLDSVDLDPTRPANRPPRGHIRPGRAAAP